jgi:hypothetical protein
MGKGDLYYVIGKTSGRRKPEITTTKTTREITWP